MSSGAVRAQASPDDARLGLACEHSPGSLGEEYFGDEEHINVLL